MSRTMSNSLRKQFGTSLASTFINEIQHQRSNYYYFLGKLDPWGVTDTEPLGTIPLTDVADVAVRNNAAYFKKITPNDVTLVCPRYDWTTGTIYTKWDDTKDMTGEQYFVLSDNNEVYKCLDNNGSAASTVMPSGRSMTPTRSSDGYVWKYMYTIPSAKRSRFVSASYIPVQKALSDTFYSNGSIESISVINGGSGYSSSPQTSVVVSGSTTGSGAVGTVTATSGVITSISLSNGGTGYTKGVKLTVTSTNGSGAVLTPVIDAGTGSITNITITSGGTGYVTGDAISFVLGGAQLIPVVSPTTKSIIDVIIYDAGAGYVGTPSLLVTSTTSASTGEFQGHAAAILTPVMENGSIKRVLIVDAGKNYLPDGQTSIVVQGDGTGLAAYPIIKDGSIIDVLIENKGYGYSQVILNVVGTGTGAILRPIYDVTKQETDQATVEQNAVAGAIYSVEVTAAGYGYTPSTVVSITGDGTGATAHAVISGTTIQKIIVDSWGSGYTNAIVTISDTNRDTTAGYPIAAAYAILPPFGGHGYNAVNELGGSTLCISSSIRNDPALIDFNQDYRQFGIVSQPQNIVTGRLSTTDFDVNAYEVTLNTVTGIAADDVLVKEGKYRFRVIFLNGTKAFLQPLQNKLTDPIGSLYKEGTNQSYVASGLQSIPIINKYSGNLMYVANESPFEFSDTQSLLIKTYLSF